VQAIEDLRREHGYASEDVAAIHIAGNPKMATINNIPSPTDLMMAQYSLPFCVALAHFHDPRDPRSFNLKSFNDTRIRLLASRVSVSVSDEAKHGHTLASTVTVTLRDGRTLTRRTADFKGTPEQPLDRAEMRDKFLLLTRHCDRTAMARLFERLADLEAEPKLDWLKVDAARSVMRPRAASVKARAPRARGV
jgi:2-methylcitrate dehydratase PrpD